MHHLAQLSLRPKGLAQASSFRLGESSTLGIVALRAFSLRRDSFRLSETFTRSNRVGRLSDNSRKRAWASLC